MIPAASRFAPWAAGINEPMRRARFRSFRTLVLLLNGRRGNDLADLHPPAIRENRRIRSGIRLGDLCHSSILPECLGMGTEEARAMTEQAGCRSEAIASTRSGEGA